jgi:hypothetical protein
VPGTADAVADNGRKGFVEWAVDQRIPEMGAQVEAVAVQDNRPS